MKKILIFGLMAIMILSLVATAKVFSDETTARDDYNYKKNAPRYLEVHVTDVTTVLDSNENLYSYETRIFDNAGLQGEPLAFGFFSEEYASNTRAVDVEADIMNTAREWSKEWQPDKPKFRKKADSLFGKRIVEVLN